MSAPADCWTARQVAAFLGHSADWFYRHRPQLERRHNLPRPVRVLGRDRWDPDQLHVWRLARQSIPLELAGEIGRQLTAAQWADEFDRRAAEIAAEIAARRTAA